MKFSMSIKRQNLSNSQVTYIGVYNNGKKQQRWITSFYDCEVYLTKQIYLVEKVIMIAMDKKLISGLNYMKILEGIIEFN
ncbi:unnamed protein product [Paramecium primaurelia]|uniref:Uncharacterized protein n=1 Tax=Paramecium primaurelia TaxID=5886 RepID=A0A8S1NCF7_PARPR|nr:unnamed protein product [Paramecium primaurelia]